MIRKLFFYTISVLAVALMVGRTTTSRAAEAPPAQYNIRDFGATGDGKTIDSPAINKAIDAAAAAGGGTVFVPPGTYLCFSIHLKSNICLSLDQAATILAADSPLDENAPGYDAPEPNEWDPYEDFGHSHWHNSLIWGENLENISIMGPGRIDGKGLSRGGNPRAQSKWRPGDGAQSAVLPTTLPKTRNRFGYPSAHDTLPAGIGNKSIALKLCRNVIFKDFTIYRGGHFRDPCDRRGQTGRSTTSRSTPTATAWTSIPAAMSA